MQLVPREIDGDIMVLAVDGGLDGTTAAAGNCDRTEPEEFPAMSESDVIGVAAIDDTDHRAAFTNFHERLALSAPAASVYGADGTPDLNRSMISSLPDGEYGVWEGTSIGVPIVAAAAAIVRSQHPEWSADAATAEAVRNRLVAGSVNIDPLNPGYSGLIGAGRLDIGGTAALGPVAPALGDLDADGLVGSDDLLALLAAWGTVHSSSDLDGDGLVGVVDLLLMIAAWG